MIIALETFIGKYDNHKHVVFVSTKRTQFFELQVVQGFDVWSSSTIWMFQFVGTFFIQWVLVIFG